MRGLGSRARGAVRSFSVFEHRRLRWYVLAVEWYPLFMHVQFLGHDVWGRLRRDWFLSR